jgi:outer membrane immunogenic protein
MSKSILRAAVIAATLAMTGNVLADGGPRIANVNDTATPAAFSWTGFYAGGSIGAQWLHDGVMTGTPADAATAGSFAVCNAGGACPFNRGSDTGSSVIGGIQAGYNIQSGTMVFGVEVDFQGSTANASRDVATNLPPVFAPFQGTANTTIEWLSTVRGRLGVTVSPSVLAYITGGFAFAEVQRSYGGAFAAPAAANWFGRDKSIETGWTVGGGLEWAVTSNMTVGGEYLYVNLGGGDAFVAGALPAGAGACTPAVCNFNVRGGDIDSHIARLKVNFKF